jgi:putative tryptophan/tyrosine transport system substrate-binding protein
MSRRFLVFCFVLAVSTLTGAAGAQQPARVPVVGLLITHAAANEVVVQSFRRGMRGYGYEDGRNVKIEVRTALGQLDRVPALAEELAQMRVDAIVVVNDVSLRSATQATRTIPIVMIGWTVDPVSLGVIESYRHPGGNVTGFYSMPAELFGKRLEILKEVLPKASRVAVLYDEFGRPQLPHLQQAARSLGIRLEPVEFSGPDGLETAFATAKRKRAGAVLLAWSPVFYVHRVRVSGLALDAGLPTVTDSDLNVEAGCLLSYGFSVSDNFERAAYFVDRLLKGAKAADLPVEQISKLKLVVNLKTAKSLHVKIPESIMLRADAVIR